ncbi:hypothetical protein PENTCL1PPCAC_28255, partial [Pristionchus entomophagus]
TFRYFTARGSLLTMLRAATRSTVRQSGARLQSSAPTPTPKPSPVPKPQKKGSAGKKLLATTATLAAAGGGVIGYAYVDPEFRHQVESTIPPTKQVFDSILGESSLEKTKHQIEDAKNAVIAAIPKRKQSAVLEPLPLEKLPPIEKKAPVHVDPVDVKPPVITETKLSEDQVKKINAQLEERLMGAIAAAEMKVKTLTQAKLTTIKAIEKHAKTLKQTVDDGQNANWENVTAALQEVENHAKTDAGAEMDGKNYIDTLLKVINDGKSNVNSRSNPLLINAMETATKLSHQVDELNVIVNQARQEAQVFNQYKDLIDRSRQQFAQELKSIVPDIDVNAKDKSLNEYEQNALIAHAHLRVDQLRRQLAEQQVREEEHIGKALESQKRADEEASTERLALEVKRLRAMTAVEIEKEVGLNRTNWESETEEKLKRASLAHSDHLEKVCRTQRQLFEIEHNQKVEEAVRNERDLHSRHVGAALSRLEGIENALGSRVALDAENRRSKQFWIACHNLIQSIVHGEKAGKDMEKRRLPLGQQLDILKQVNGEDSFVDSVISVIPEQAKNTGCYTHQDLKNRFDKLYTTGRRTAQIDTNGGTIGKYAWSYVRSLFLVDLPRRFSYEDKIDPVSIDNLEVLARAKFFVERDDLESAAKMLNLLTGEPSILAGDWVRDTRAHLETKFIAEILVAHAAVQSIRSTY